MMKITEHLNVEHGFFLSQLAHLEALLKQDAPAEVLSAVLQTIARAVETHREVEEKFLYPAIQQSCGRRGSPIEVMEREHEEIGDAIRKVKSGFFSALTVSAFIDVLRQHIEKEIQVLFPLAEECVPERELHAMSRRAVMFVHARAGVKLSR